MGEVRDGGCGGGREPETESGWGGWRDSERKGGVKWRGYVRGDPMLLHLTGSSMLAV